MIEPKESGRPEWVQRLGELNRRIRVLSIDDDPNIAEAMGRALRNYGMQLIPCYLGAQGYWVAATEKPDCIVLDLSMPFARGEEVLQWLKSNRQTAAIPVIVLTGTQRMGQERAMYKAGADAYLTKPAPADQLAETIAHLVLTRPRIDSPPDEPVDLQDEVELAPSLVVSPVPKDVV